MFSWNKAQPSYFFRIWRLKTFLPASYCIRIWGLTFLNLFLTWVSILAFFQAHFCIKYEFTHSNGNTVYSLFKSWQVKQKPKMRAVFFSRISTLRNWRSCFLFLLKFRLSNFLRTFLIFPDFEARLLIKVGSYKIKKSVAGDFFERFSKNSICPKCKNSIWKG